MIEKTKFMKLDALRLVNEKGDELVALTEVGPRIISFKPEGKENFLYVNKKEIEKVKKGDSTWYSFGGSRLWVAPEYELTYTPDNLPCDTVVEGNKAKIVAPVDEQTGLRRMIEIEVGRDTFSITHRIKNERTHLFTAGLWVLTCLAPYKGAEIYLPWGGDSSWDVKDMRYWKKWLVHGSNIASRQWKPTAEFFIVKTTLEQGKVGFPNRRGFALYRCKKLSFIKKSDYIETAQYPDDGCTFEVYTSKDFYELETLSPLYCMKPGAAYTHKEEWWAGFEKVDVSTIAAANEFVAGKFFRK
jgi:hypothetical protein